MAIVREYRKPDFFITMTCNPKWKEIDDELLEGQTPQDRPDIVSRVFKLKYDQLMDDLITGQLLGKVVAHLEVVEFQKRGLPHAHILLILADDDRVVTREFVDNIIVAELPPSPNDVDDPEVKESRQRLEDIVLQSMVHGPCGEKNPLSPCMENGRCTKKYPKEFLQETIVNLSNSTAIYRRRSVEHGGREIIKENGQVIDNRWIVPYNPFLSLRYNCHINIESCVSPQSTKYIFKYVHKGSDRQMMTTEIDGQPRDEIADYIDMRSVGSSEAAWLLFGFPITSRYPAVTALRVHLEEEQQIVFDENLEIEALENQRSTELTAFFSYNEANSENPECWAKYVDMPKRHVYDQKKKEWRNRKQGNDTVIGRVHSVNPVAGEVFYLRILLHNNHCLGKTSFKDMLKLPNGRECESYKEVCVQLGLLNDDQEWERILESAAATQMCPQIRELFVIILIFCMPSNPLALFNTFWDTWYDDFERKAARRGAHLTENQLKTMVLLDIELRLSSHEKSLHDFMLPEPSEEEIIEVEHVNNTEPPFIREELDFDVDVLKNLVEERVHTFTPEQSHIYQNVMNAVTNDRPIQIFIDARGGCGKTYLINTILAAVRSCVPRGNVALAMATTGIAGNLLELGRTFHSRMKAPLKPMKDSTLNISSQSNLATLIRMAKLLLIDEATMLDRFQLEALDRTLRDLMQKPDKPFGDKIIILAGDFRQCLPVVPGATRAGTVEHCLNQSHLWNNFVVLNLTTNMRVGASGDPELEDFDSWTLDIGRLLEL